MRGERMPDLSPCLGYDSRPTLEARAQSASPVGGGIVPVILDDSQRMALQYVQAANSGGYRPTTAEVDEWRLRPTQLPGKRGKLISPATPGEPPLWMRNLAQANSHLASQTMASLMPSLSSISKQMHTKGLFGTPGTPARYEPDGPPEAFLDALIRLSWLTKDERGGLSTTALSRALLRSEEVAHEDSGDVFVLAEGDPLAYATLLGHVAEMGQVLVIDPYLRAEQLLSFLEHTNADRFLIGSKVDKSSVVAMQTLLSATGWASSPELRQATAGSLHDRHIVGDTQVYTLGMSLNAVGRTSTTVLMPLPSAAADHVRGRAEDAWATAKLLAPTTELAHKGEVRDDTEENSGAVESKSPGTSERKGTATKKAGAKGRHGKSREPRK